MYRAVVFFDLDGTLLDSYKRVQRSSLKALQELRANHILPVISTGRSLLMIRSIMTKTQIHTAICANGSYIQYKNEPLNIIPIPTDIIERLIKLSGQNGKALAFQTRDHIVLNRANPLTHAAYLHHSVNPTVRPDFYRTHPINFINLFTTNHGYYYVNQFKNQLTIVCNSTKCLDITKAGVSKQLGIKILLKKLHIAGIPTYAFGDGLNDVQMFDQVDHPIAMGEGLKPCKERSEFVTDTNDRGGIFKGLAHFGLVK